MVKQLHTKWSLLIALDLCQAHYQAFHCDKCIDWKSYLDYVITKDDQLIFRCFKCKNNYKKTLIKI